MVKCWDLNSASFDTQCRLFTSASQIFFILPFTFLYINMAYIIRKKKVGGGGRDH